MIFHGCALVINIKIRKNRYFGHVTYAMKSDEYYKKFLADKKEED